MTGRRLILPTACCALTAAMLAWLVAGRTNSATPAIGPIVPGESVAIDSIADRAVFDLEFRPESRYALIVASLGDSGTSYRVSLESERVKRTAPLRGRRVEPIPKERRLQAMPRAGLGANYAHPDPVRAVACEPAARGTKFAKTRDFFIHVTDGDLGDANQYARVTGELVREAESVRVFLDRQQSAESLAPGVVDEIARIFDDAIVPRFRATLGETRDVDGDGKFCILLTPWLGRLQGGRTSLGGFVRGSDFRPDARPPFGNGCDMLYLNSNAQPGKHLETLLTHEYTHAVCFSTRLPSAQDWCGLPDEEDWLNEAIAHVGEGLTGSDWSNLDYRISRYLTSPERYPLVVPDYYRAGLWRDHGCRGATYLFLQWFVNTFGEDSLSQIIHSSSSGTRNLERLSGREFDEVFRAWTIALLQSDGTAAASGRPGCSRDLEKPPRTFQLRGEVGQFALAGPRIHLWNVGSDSCNFHLKGRMRALNDFASLGGVARACRRPWCDCPIRCRG
jgi:hypothetical protein